MSVFPILLVTLIADGKQRPMVENVLMRALKSIILQSILILTTILSDPIDIFLNNEFLHRVRWNFIFVRDFSN